MKGEELAQIRTESGLTQGEFAKILNDTLDMKYRGTTVNAWEKGSRKIPRFVEEAALLLSGKSPEEVIEETVPKESEGFTPPSQPEDTGPELARIASGMPTSLEQACIEMFSGIGMMVEVAGSVMNQPKVVHVYDSTGKPTQVSLIEFDGKIIQGDAEKLGRAWAKLAEKNEWVARIITSLTGGGAWVEALAVTSGTMFSVYKNHIGYAEHIRKQAESNGGNNSEEPSETTGEIL